MSNVATDSADQSSATPGLFRTALDFVFPPACTLCRRALRVGRDLCDECRDELQAVSPNVCERCCAPVGPHLHTAEGCIHCCGDRFAFHRVRALGAYAGRLRSACRQAKQDPSGRIGRTLADLLWMRWGAALQTSECDLIVPVPAHWTTRFMRSAAPASTVAERLAHHLKLPCDSDVVRKIRRTPAQATLAPTRRRNNLQHAFALTRGLQLNNVRVLLVDDVLTTGTTAHRLAGVLRRAGAERVDVAVLARGVGQ